MKKIAKRFLACFLSFAAIAMLATGCSKSNSSSNSSNSNSSSSSNTKSGNQTITIWIAGQPSEITFYTQMFKELAAKNDCTAKIATQSNIADSLNAAINSNDLPDIAQVDGTQIATYEWDDILLPINTYITQDTLNDLLPSVKNEITNSNGDIYAIGQFDSGLSLWANKSMLQKAGVRIPTSYKNAWSKSEFEDALAKLKASGVKYPLDINQDSTDGQVFYYTWLPIVKSFGGDWLNRETNLTAGTLNGKATVDALNYITWLISKGYINKNQDYSDSFYGKKESALQLLGHWMAPENVQGLGADAILVPIPNFGHGVYTGIGSSCWSILKPAKKDGTEAKCGAILEGMMSSEYVKGITAANGSVPALKSVLDSDKDYQQGGRYYLYREQLEAGIGYSRPKTPATVYMVTEIGKVFKNVISGESAQSALDDASKNIDANIKQNQYNTYKN